MSVIVHALKPDHFFNQLMAVTRFSEPVLGEVDGSINTFKIPDTCRSAIASLGMEVDAKWVFRSSYNAAYAWGYAYAVHYLKAVLALSKDEWEMSGRIINGAFIAMNVIHTALEFYGYETLAKQLPHYTCADLQITISHFLHPMAMAGFSVFSFLNVEETTERYFRDSCILRAQGEIGKAVALLKQAEEALDAGCVEDRSLKIRMNIEKINHHLKDENEILILLRCTEALVRELEGQDFLVENAFYQMQARIFRRLGFPQKAEEALSRCFKK